MFNNLSIFDDYDLGAPPSQSSEEEGGYEEWEVAAASSIPTFLVLLLLCVLLRQNLEAARALIETLNQLFSSLWVRFRGPQNEDAVEEMEMGAVADPLPRPPRNLCDSEVIAMRQLPNTHWV